MRVAGEALLRIVGKIQLRLIDLRWWLSMRLQQNRYTFSAIVFVRTVVINLKMRPRRWRSWRHHRLVLGVGYFTLNYSKLEQEFVEQAYILATKRGWALSELDKKAEHEAYKQASSISGSDFKKAATWAKQARQMTVDPALLLEVDRIVTEASRLSTVRQTIMHNFGFFGDQFALTRPATYLQAYQYVKADWGKKYSEFKLKTPIIHRYTYHHLKHLDAETSNLTNRIHKLGRLLTQDFHRFTSEEKR